MKKDPVIKTIAVYDKIASEYAKKIDEYLPKPELQTFLSLLPKNATILDAGCGPGRDCEYFVQHGLRVVGVVGSEAEWTTRIDVATADTNALIVDGVSAGRSGDRAMSVPASSTAQIERGNVQYNSSSGAGYSFLRWLIAA